VAGEDLLDVAVHLAGALPLGGELALERRAISTVTTRASGTAPSEISVSNGLMVSIMTTTPTW